MSVSYGGPRGAGSAGAGTGRAPLRGPAGSPSPGTGPRTGRVRHRAVVAAVVLLAFVVVCPLLVADPDRADFAGLLAGPSAEHLLGTDQLGRDLLAAIPVVLFGLLAAVALGPGAASLLVAVTAIAWTPFARQAYLLTLAERGREYVTAAVSLGAGPVRVLAGHVGRNVLPPLAAHACVRFASTLLTVSGLSFLGLGVQPPTAEWGAMVAEGREYLFTAPHVVLVPSVAVVLTAGTALWCGRRWERAGTR